MRRFLVLAAAGLLSCQALQAQPPARAPVSAREAAPIDMAGYWISVVTEDWMFRMVTPPRGEYRGVPLNREGRALADTWDPERDAANGGQCKSYGAPALMRIPGRLHISWEDDSTLRIDAEAGGQSRLLYFGAVPAEPDPLQGTSRARWERAAGDAPTGKLVAETGGFQPGYLRKNGVPHSADARLTEYYNVYEAPQGDTWLVVTTEVDDPRYLSQPFVTSSHFKKLSGEEGEQYWSPVECRAQ